jgi:ABC transporter substrate binding protein
MSTWSRRNFILLGGVTAVWPLAARGQQPTRLPRVGVLVGTSPPFPLADALRQGLQALGYSDRNIALEFRYTMGRSDRATELAAELVRLGVNVMVTHWTQATRAALEATSTIPIVMVVGAPLQSGFVDSLARPSGNATGLSGVDAELAGKRLQLLRDIMPGALPVSPFSERPRPPTRIADRSWRISVWRPRMPASGLSQY